MWLLYAATVFDALIVSWMIAYKLKFISKTKRYNIFSLSEVSHGGTHGILFGELIYDMIAILGFTINLYLALSSDVFIITAVLFIGAVGIYLYSMYNSFGKRNRLVYRIIQLFEKIQYIQDKDEYSDIKNKYFDCFQKNKCDLEISTDGLLVEVHSRTGNDTGTIEDTVNTNFKSVKESFLVLSKYIFYF